MSDLATLADLAARVLIAVTLGAAIGLERQWRLRTVGIRTNALVSAGSALFVILGAEAFADGATADPTRVAAQVVSGIGFLGAGVILRDGINVRGLTSAATLWCAAAVGSLAGAGMPLLGLVGSVAIVATNTLLRPVGRLVNRRAGSSGDSADTVDDETGVGFVLEVVTSEKNELRVRALVLNAVDRPELTLRSLRIRPGKESRLRVVAELQGPSTLDTSGLENAIQRLGLDPKVLSSRWWPAADD
jgi:putative Mg2+ transporter-C (MgtC) family protein